MTSRTQRAVNAGRTNDIQGTIVRVISAPSSISWISPEDNSTFNIGCDATFPEIIFEFYSDMPPPYLWNWEIKWEAKSSGLRERARRGRVIRTFSKAGDFSSTEKRWQLNVGEEIIGGDLTVSVNVGGEVIRRTVKIREENPSAEDVSSYINSIENLEGFDKLLEQETRNKHFINFDNEPVVAFDGGYGITQMTNPIPTYEQVWNWKKNIDGGSDLYIQKRKNAQNYLGKDGRTYTEEQLQHETISRWNGGAYHEWNESEQQWQRKSNILCDSQTGNIGWDTTNPSNQDRTEEELHDRDHEQYSMGGAGQDDEHPWRYSGVCYADHVID
ncbi:hypothetical protein [Citrobacter sp. UYEF32]|uniref:hypothetical protein n=1 Tax=Citrobacter sp. UYEF32 TaxID=3156347 RepID=UPI003397160D